MLPPFPIFCSKTESKTIGFNENFGKREKWCKLSRVKVGLGFHGGKVKSKKVVSFRCGLKLLNLYSQNMHLSIETLSKKSNYSS